MSEIYDAKNMVCLHCKVPFPKWMTMKYGRGGKLIKGMIMVCSNCTGAMVLGDSSWRPMEKKDFDALPNQAKVSLVLIVKGLKQKLGAGKDWNPYEEASSKN